MAQRSSSEQRERRSKARERRRSLAAEPFEQLDEAARKEQQPDGGKGADTLKQAATTAVAGAVAAGLAGVAKAMRDRRDESDERSSPDDGELLNEQREDSPAEQTDDQPVGDASMSEEGDVRSLDDDGGDGDSGDDPQAGSDGGGESRARQEEPADEDASVRGASGGDAKEVVDKARQELQELLGVEPESVSGFERSNGRWTVTLEVVDVRRVPESTDVLSSYEVAFDDDRNLVSVAQKRRYRRSQVEEGR
jgi:hypothetical protein